MGDNYDSENNTQHYKVGYALDDDGFFRKACSDCGLEYKVEAGHADIQWSLSAPVERTMDIRAIPAEEVQASATETCPYCGSRSAPNENHTDEFMRHGRVILEREAVAPLINDLLATIDKAFTSLRNSRFIKVTTSGTGIIPPQRPIIGPEPNDMRRVELLCCNKRLKTLEGWTQTIFCPYCSAHLVLQ